MNGLEYKKHHWYQGWIGLCSIFMLFFPAISKAKTIHQCLDENQKYYLSSTPCPQVSLISKRDRSLSDELNGLGFQAMSKGEFEKAKTYLERAITLNPKNSFALLNFGVLYDRMNDDKNAQIQFQKALEVEFELGRTPNKSETVINNPKSPNYGLTLTDLVLKNWNKQLRKNDKILKLKGDVARGQTVYRNLCSEKCHQPEGWGSIDGAYPQIAGQHATVTIKQLLDIREGNRDNPTMFRFSLPSELGGEQAIADVVAYIETLPMTVKNGVGPGKNLALGAQKYAEFCARCHGKDGEGNAKEFYPRIHGQHYQYQVRQFQWMQDNKRRNIHPLKRLQIKNINAQEMSAILDYISRLKPPKELLDRPQNPVPQAAPPDKKGQSGKPPTPSQNLLD
ncbi:MAG: c-type cytochrome [Magnetococcales bacterium]|nr:c-type cytochrome [Magnetococcales bacterium]